MSKTQHVTPDDLRRDAKALTEAMVVDPHDGMTGQAMVYSGENSQYLVDLATGSCDCPDCLHRGVRCKHIRRVEFVLGERPIPKWVDDDDRVDPALHAQRERYDD